MFVRRSANAQSYRSECIHICSGTVAASLSPMKAAIHGLFKTTSGIATSRLLKSIREQPQFGLKVCGADLSLGPARHLVLGFRVSSSCPDKLFDGQVRNVARPALLYKFPKAIAAPIN